MDSWQKLRLELEREAEAIFTSSGEVVVVAPDREFGSVVRASLKVTSVPEKDAVKWESPDEYGFDPIPEEIASLARSLMRRVRR